MKKVKARATSALLIALMVIVGLAVYLVRLTDDGGKWASYFSGATIAGTITDRAGVVLYHSENGAYRYADDWTTRVSTYQLIGDPNGNVGTGALRQFRDKLSGYSFINGTSKSRTLALTVDADLNNVAYNALAGRNGTVMVMDYTTGEVLCLVSTPSMDPQNPSSSPAEGTYLNKALSASFVPGSIFKLVTIAAAIENIPDLYERSFYCGGSFDAGGSTVVCTGTHGYQTIEQALSNSCNCAFGQLSLELGADLIAEYAGKFGLTSEHELDGITTAAGSFGKGAAGSFDLAWSGMGQFNDMVNPYAMLRYVAAIANGGTLMEPNLTGGGFFSRREKLLSPETADKIAAMMSYNVENAYGTWNFPGLSLCAKTGTAETGNGTSHSWFTGFLDNVMHPYAFIVLVENAGGGLTHAGAVANTVLQAAVAK